MPDNVLAAELRKPQIFVVDDREEMLEIIPELLESKQQLQLYSSAEQFLAQVEPFSFGCAIVDQGLPGMNGIELIETLKTRESTLSSILITGSADVALVVNAFEHGITAFLEKPLSAACLQLKVKQALDISRTTYIERWNSRKAEQRAKLLTPREAQVLGLLIEGIHSKLIAKKLGMAYNTARVHRANVLKKMRVQSVVELLNMVRAR